MIIFGSRTKTIAGKQFKVFECTNCQNNAHTSFGLLSYFHIFWIPVFPIKKNAGIECLHCKQTLIGKELPKEIRRKINSTVFTKKNMLPAFIGLILIALLTVWGFFVSETNHQRELTYLESPQVKDIYLVDFTKIFEDADSTYKYGMIRVRFVSDQTVEVEPSAIGYDRMSGPRQDIRAEKFNAPDYYTKERIRIQKTELKNLKLSRAIYSVERL